MNNIKRLTLALTFFILLPVAGIAGQTISGTGDDYGLLSPSGETGSLGERSSAGEKLMEDYIRRPSGNRASVLADTYFDTGAFAAASEYYRQAADIFRRREERARAFYNAGTAVIEANRAAQGSAGSASPGNGEPAPKPPSLETAIDYLHRSLDLVPDREDAAYNLEIARIMLTQQQDENNQDQQEEEQEEEQKESGEDESGTNSDSGESSRTDESSGNQDSQSNEPGEGEEQEAGSSPDGQEPREATETGEASESEELSEEELQERLSEILGNEEENRQLREALMEKRGGISNVERDW